MRSERYQPCLVRDVPLEPDDRGGKGEAQIRLWQFLCTLTPFLDAENELVVDNLIW